MRAPKAGGAMQTLARGLPYVRAIAVDDTRVYLSDEKNILTVPKVPANKPEAPAQWAALGSVVHLAVDHGALFWTGSAAERITALERTVQSDQAAIEKVAVLEEQARGIRESLDRIESKLDNKK